MKQTVREALEIEAKYNLEIESNYIPLNIWSIKVLGFDAALMFAVLYEEHLYQRSKGNSGNFKCSIKTVKDRICFSEDRQRKAIKVLVNKGLINAYLNRSVDENGRINKRCRMFRIIFDSYGFKQYFKDIKLVREKRDEIADPYNSTDLPF